MCVCVVGVGVGAGGALLLGSGAWGVGGLAGLGPMLACLLMAACHAAHAAASLFPARHQYSAQPEAAGWQAAAHLPSTRNKAGTTAAAAGCNTGRGLAGLPLLCGAPAPPRQPGSPFAPTLPQSILRSTWPPVQPGEGGGGEEETEGAVGQGFALSKGFRALTVGGAVVADWRGTGDGGATSAASGRVGWGRGQAPAHWAAARLHAQHMRVVPMLKNDGSSGPANASAPGRFGQERLPPALEMQQPLGLPA